MITAPPAPPAPVVTVAVATVSVAEPDFTVTVAVALAPLAPEAAARATDGCLSVRFIEGRTWRTLTLTEGVADINDLGFVDVARA